MNAMDAMNAIKVLALSGSLCKASLDTAMLSMACAFAPTSVRVRLHRGLGELPLFNPDLESNQPRAPIARAALRGALRALGAALRKDTPAPISQAPV